MAVGSHALASGGREPQVMFFMSRGPDQPLHEFIAAPAGFYSDYRVQYQMIWYWHLRGERFTPEAVTFLADTLSSIATANYQHGADEAWKNWSQARRKAYKTLGQPLPAAKDKDSEHIAPSSWSSEQFNDSVSCYDDAFVNATDTLLKRMAHLHKDNSATSSLLLWLAMQDWVFDRCGNASQRSPPVLPDTAPAWLKADYAYQRAAGSFYVNEVKPLPADQAFQAVAADGTNPWRDLAAYMRLRTLARATPGPDPYPDSTNPNFDLAKAVTAQQTLNIRVEAIVEPLLLNPKLLALRPSIYRLREALRIRLLRPKQRMEALANGLQTIGNPHVAAARILLLQREMRLCQDHYFDPYCGDALGANQSNDLLLWLNTVRGFEAREPTGHTPAWQAQTSWRAWKRDHALHWLFAAANFVSANDKGQRASLQQALVKVPMDSPAGYAARQLRALQFRAESNHTAVRKLLVDAAASPLIAHSASGQNIVKALLLPSAATEAEWQRLALRTVVGIRDPETDIAVAPSTLTTTFDVDVAKLLNRNAPLAMWLRLASHSCWRRLNSEPPCRFNIEPGLDAVRRTSVCG